MDDLIAVVGSLNRDTVLRVPALPAPGETVLATSITHFRGGKGANQALAASRLGRPVAMIGKVGADADGTSYLRSLVAEDIDVEGVGVDIHAATGHAFISLDGAGENSIVVLAGANGRLSPEDVAAVSHHIEGAAVTLAQLEVPLDAVKAAAQLSGGRFVLNPAPAQHLGPELLSLVDVLVANRTELARLADDTEAHAESAIIAQAQKIRGPGAVVVTVGAAGAIVVEGGEGVVVPAPRVESVDTTGAGDAFCGGLADALARGESLHAAVEWAVAVGAAATTMVGAQTALPERSRVLALLEGS